MISIHLSKRRFSSRIIIWTATSEKVTSSSRKICGCTRAKSHPDVCSWLKYFIVSNDSVCGQRRPRSAFAQADLGFRPRKSLVLVVQSLLKRAHHTTILPGSFCSFYLGFGLRLAMSALNRQPNDSKIQCRVVLFENLSPTFPANAISKSG